MVSFLVWYDTAVAPAHPFAPAPHSPPCARGPPVTAHEPWQCILPRPMSGARVLHLLRLLPFLSAASLRCIDNASDPVCNQPTERRRVSGAAESTVQNRGARASTREIKPL